MTSLDNWLLNVSAVPLLDNLLQNRVLKESPRNSFQQSETEPFALTNCCLSFKYDLNTLEEMPRFRNTQLSHQNTVTYIVTLNGI